MLAEFETRLTEVLGSRLQAPFAGRVIRRGDPAPSGSGPMIQLGVDSAEPIDPELASSRPEVVPGSAALRRVVRMRTVVGFDVVATSSGGRAQRVVGVDHLIYELDDPGMRSAKLLDKPGDPGFLIQSLELAGSNPDADVDVASAVSLVAEGWFWPVGVTGEEGPPITTSLIREFKLPILVTPDDLLLAGGPAVKLRLAFGPTGTMRVQSDAVVAEAFGRLAVRLVNPSGGPGAGGLAGGQAGPDGHRLLIVGADGTSVNYTPPPSPAVDTLVVSTHASETASTHRIGMELARFDLVVT